MINDVPSPQKEVPAEQIDNETPSPAEKPTKTPKLVSQHRFHIWPQKWSTKKKRTFTAILVVLILALIGAGGYNWYKTSRLPKVKNVPLTAKHIDKPTTVASRLTGVQISPELNSRAVTGIMIENSPDARPQSGLQDAGVVYEAIAEGGITRFLALFMESQPDYVGPIRSARPYYLDWLLPFDASYAHVGGSPEALQQIKDLHIKDLDQFANSGSYSRVTSRYAPHNVYTSIAKLYDLAQSKGYKSSSFTGFARKKETKATAPNARTIDLNISAYLYSPHYDYDVTTNSYKRSEGGKPHTEAPSGVQIAPKVVIALVIPYSIAADGQHSSYATTGSGTMSVFQDGTVTTGTWKKDSRASQFVFTDSTGAPLKLNPGQTWISIVNTAADIVYKP